MYEQVRKRANRHERMVHHGLRRIDPLLVHAAFVDQQDVLVKGGGMAGKEPVDEIKQRGLPRHGRDAHPGLLAVLPHLAGAVFEHLLFFLGFLAVERQEAGFQAFDAHGGHQLGELRPGGQEVKTSPFHGGNTGSIPVRVTQKRHSMWNVFFRSPSGWRPYFVSPPIPTAS